MKGVPSSLIIGAIALVSSLLVHGLGLAVRTTPAPVATEGEGGAAIAVQGTSFADYATGVSQPVAGPVPSNQPLPDVVTPVVNTTLPTARANAARTAVEPEPARPVQPTAARKVATPRVEMVEVLTEAEAARPVQTATEPLAAVEDTATPRLSTRPRTRPAAIEARAAEVRAAEAAARDAARQATARARPQGNGQRTATRGAADGQTTGTATSSGTGQSRTAGNAAASNYPGQVQRRISRQRMPRGVGRGTARVSFTVSGSGGLAALGIAASSGSGALDRAALSIIRRAAPFPAPPPGAQRSFVIPVQAR